MTTKSQDLITLEILPVFGQQHAMQATCSGGPLWSLTNRYRPLQPCRLESGNARANHLPIGPNVWGS